MQINSSTTWQPVKTQLTCSRLFKFLPFSRCYSNKPFLQTMAAKTRFSHYQKASNGKINSTEVFLMMKGTSVWKIIPNELCYQRQDLKNRFFEVWLQEYASNCKTNSTGVFLAMKGTSVWKISPNGLRYWPQNQKKPVGKLHGIHQPSLFTLPNFRHYCLTLLNFCHYFCNISAS